ncbi:hypothetical protein BC828DRAFT_394462, partial [Blastocladiella britannica]
TDVASVAKIDIFVPSQAWHNVAMNGHTKVIIWALVNGLLEADVMLDGIILQSAPKGDVSLLLGWFARHQSNAEAIAHIKNDEPDIYSKFLFSSSVRALNWWWNNMANWSELPEEELLHSIVWNALRLTDSTTVVEWWWKRFLEHRSPTLTFWSTGHIFSPWDFSIECAEWLFQHSHISGTQYDASLNAFAIAPDWHDQVLPPFTSPQSLHLLEWWQEKFAIIGQPVRIGSASLVRNCVHAGDVHTLDYLLQQSHTENIEWGSDLVFNATKALKLQVLEWWDAHSDQLPPQSMRDFSWVKDAISACATDILVWWYNRDPSIFAYAWDDLISCAIKHNSRELQHWLLSRPELVSEKFNLADDAFAGREPPPLYTLDFVTHFFADPNAATRFKQLRTTMLGERWQCYANGTKIDSLLPLSPAQWDRVVCSYNVWWLQAHLAAGHVPVFPHVGTMSALEESDNDKSTERLWFRDVVITRGITLLMQSVADPDVIVPFELPGDVASW